MADFTIEVVSSHEVADWEDRASALLPSRLNAPRYPHRYRRILGPFPYTLELKALIDGAEVVDAGLGGNLFIWGWQHYGNGPVPGFVTVAVGESFNQEVTLTESNTGLWLVRCWRKEHGAVLTGVNVEP